MENEIKKEPEREAEPILIRKAVSADIPAICRLLLQVHRVHSDLRPDLFRVGARKYGEKEVAEILQNPERPVFVAERAGEVRGYAFCIFKQFVNDESMTDVLTLYIDDLCVDREARGEHIGSALYAYVRAFAKQSGCYNLTLNVWADNVDALRFYQHVGLKVQKYGMETIL